MYMSKKKFDEIKAKHSTTIVVDADVGEALAFVQDLLEAEADAIKNREPHATASIGRLNEAAYEQCEQHGGLPQGDLLHHCQLPCYCQWRASPGAGQ